MADESNENAITGDVHGMAPDTGKKDDADVSASGVLDLRPPQESLKAELCRLGLEYSSTDAAAWNRGVIISVACSLRSTRPART